jgi:hypothetical protein
VRYSVLAAALLANTVALWLVFQEVKLRIHAVEDPAQSAAAASAQATSLSQTQIS